MNKQNRRKLKEIATILRTLHALPDHTAKQVNKAIQSLDKLLEEHAHHEHEDRRGRRH